MLSVFFPTKLLLFKMFLGTSVLKLPWLPIYKKYKEYLITLWLYLIKVIIFFKKIKCCALDIVKVTSLCEKWSSITIQDKGCGNLRPELWVKTKIKQAVPCIYAWGYVYKKFSLKSKMFSQLVCYTLPKIWFDLVVYFIFLFFYFMTSCLKELTQSTSYNIIYMDSVSESSLPQVQAIIIKLVTQSKPFQASFWLKQDNYSKINPS